MTCLEEDMMQSARHTRIGRPMIEVEEQQLKFLLESRFCVKDIALLLGCSKRTVERRMHTYHLSSRSFSNITDDNLDDTIKAILSSFPSMGEKLTQARLLSQGIHVPRQRLRESIRRVDYSGIHTRMRNVLHRRAYQVNSPNDVWHVDTYHKLIRWRVVIQGGIDGFSRLITFLRASPNNESGSMFSAFGDAVNEFGLPSKVRSDHGGENILIARYMLDHPERGPGTMLTGKSTHNQRIERLWRDLFSGCVKFFYYFFYWLEDAGILNPDDETDLYCLHFLFMPLIQNQLDCFRQAWAVHPLRTERSETPLSSYGCLDYVPHGLKIQKTQL